MLVSQIEKKLSHFEISLKKTEKSIFLKVNSPKNPVRYSQTDSSKQNLKMQKFQIISKTAQVIVKPF